MLHTIVGCLADLTKSGPLLDADNLGVPSERDSTARRSERAFVGTESGKHTRDTASAKEKVDDDDWHRWERKDILGVLRAFAMLRGEFDVKLGKVADW
jgi:hypothetical protein